MAIYLTRSWKEETEKGLICDMAIKINLNKNFYVYRHFYYDKGKEVTFYVGKGLGKRVLSLDRNDSWNEIVNSINGEYYIDIIEYFDNESECVAYEKELQMYYKSIGECKGCKDVYLKDKAIKNSVYQVLDIKSYDVELIDVDLFNTLFYPITYMEADQQNELIKRLRQSGFSGTKILDVLMYIMTFGMYSMVGYKGEVKYIEYESERLYMWDQDFIDTVCSICNIKGKSRKTSILDKLEFIFGKKIIINANSKTSKKETFIIIKNKELFDYIMSLVTQIIYK